MGVPGCKAVPNAAGQAPDLSEECKAPTTTLQALKQFARAEERHFTSGEALFSSSVPISVTTQAALNAPPFRRPMTIDPVAERFEGGLMTLDKTLDMPSTDGNRVTPYNDGVNALPKMLDMINNAKRYVNVETFQCEPDESGWALANAAAAAADRGVKVRFMYDAVGSGDLSAMVKVLQAHGVQVCKHGSWFRHQFRVDNRDHRKLVVADDVAMMGAGINWADPYTQGGTNKIVYNTADKKYETSWRDAANLIEGPAVQQLNQLYLTSWKDLHGPLSADELALFNHAVPPIEGGQRLWILGDRPSKEDHHNIARMNDAARALAGKEKQDHRDETVVDTVISAYFVPPDRDLNRWLDSLKKGVKLRIMVPAPLVNDESLDASKARDPLVQLVAAGAEVWYYDASMLHQKGEAIGVGQAGQAVHGVYFRAGSQNENGRSNDADDELVAAGVNRDKADDLLMRFEQLKRDGAHQVTLDELNNIPLRQRIEDYLLGSVTLRRNI